ncbi:MAG: hypothetical protein WC916_04385 [Candidatus Woesearchaeota archaeon]
MSIIISLQTTTGEPARVLAADKLFSRLPFESYLSELMSYGYSMYNDLFEGLIFMMRKHNLDHVSFNYEHKLLISPDARSAFAFSAGYHPIDYTRDLLLEPRTFFSNIPLMKKLFFPIVVPDNAEEIIRDYGASFNLETRLKSGYFPEIRRLIESESVHAITENIGGQEVTSYGTEHIGVIFSYIFSSANFCNSTNHPRALHIASTGAVVEGLTMAFGSGANDAMAYLHKEKVLSRFGIPAKDITLARAIDIVRSTIEYVNTQNPYCDGFEYVIIRDSGMESHLNEDTGSRKEYPLTKVIDDRKAYLSQCISRLEKIKEEYHSLGDVSSSTNKIIE